MDPDSNLPPAYYGEEQYPLWRYPSLHELSNLHIPVPADRQELSWEGQVLMDELTLQNYHIPPNASLTVLTKIKVEIYVEYSRFYFVCEVHDGATVGELKAKVCAEQSIDVEHKVLRMNGFDLDDGALLWAATVMEGTKLHLIKYQN
ncbi:ubiquitin 9, partial [Prunus dulcis]